MIRRAAILSLLLLGAVAADQVRIDHREGTTGNFAPVNLTTLPGYVLTFDANGNPMIGAMSGGGLSDGDKGGITVSGSGANWTVNAGHITLARLADLAQGKIIGRATASAGIPEALTLGPDFTYALGNIALAVVPQPINANLTDLAGLAAAQGDIIIGNGAGDWTKLAKGTAGQVLAMNAGATLPEWSTAAGSGATLGANTFTGVQTLPNGVVGTPSLNFGDATTGFFRPALNQIGFTTAGTSRLTLGTTATFAVDINTTGQVQVGATQKFLFSGRGGLYGTGDGLFTFYNTATSGFDRLQLGGTTTAFPAIKRSGAGIAIRLADDSADGALSVAAEPYGAGWNDDPTVPTKEDLYEKISTMSGGSVAADAIFDAKGDLAVGTGSDTAARLAVGTNNFVLTADSAQATGLKWAAATGGGVAAGDSPTWTGAHTYSTNGAANTPVAKFTGTPFVGDATTSKALMLLEPTGATSNAWGTTGNMLGLNAATGFAGNLINAQLNGVSRMTLSSSGVLTTFNDIFSSAGALRVGNTGTVQWGSFVTLGALGANNLRVGNFQSASPVAQTVTIGENSRPGTDSNVGGANGTIQSGLGTGTGTASSLIFQTPTVAASGSTVQTQTTRLTLNASGATFATPLLLPQMTKAARNALTAVNGMLVYQTDATPGLRVYENGAWVRFTATADP